MSRFDIAYNKDYHLQEGKWIDEDRLDDSIRKEFNENKLTIKNINTAPDKYFDELEKYHYEGECQDNESYHYKFGLNFCWNFTKASISVKIWDCIENAQAEDLSDIRKKLLLIYKSLKKSFDKIQIDKPAKEIDTRLAEILKEGKFK